VALGNLGLIMGLVVDGMAEREDMTLWLEIRGKKQNGRVGAE